MFIAFVVRRAAYLHLKSHLLLALTFLPLPTQVEMHALETILALTSPPVPHLSLDTESSAVGSVPYHNPTLGGGSMLINAKDGYGEPLNVRLSPCLR